MHKREAADGLEAEAWAILGLAVGLGRPLAVDEDFFAHGGDSIKAAFAAVALTQLYEQPVAVRDLLTWPTAGAISRELAARRAGGERAEVRPGGAQHILIVPHDADVSMLRLLDPAVRERLDLTVFAAPADEIGEYRSARELAEHMLRALPDPAAVRLVAGYCSATPVAYELAKLLRGLTTQAPRVLLAEAGDVRWRYAPLRTLLGTHLSQDDLVRFLDYFPEELRLSAGVPAVSAEHPAQLWPILDKIVRDDVLELVGLDAERISEPVLRGLITVHAAFMRLLLSSVDYEFEPCGLEVVAVLHEERDDALAFWRDFAGAEVVAAPKAHEHMLRDNALWSALLATDLREALATVHGYGG